MKKIISLAVLLLAFAVTGWAQSQRMSPDDQSQFNSYYSRWIADKQTNNRDDMLTMEQRMQDLMSKYAIPSSTPYDEIASQNPALPPTRDDGYYPPASQWQGRLSPDDQKTFNKEYEKWQESNAKNDRDDIDKHARKMEEIMTRYNIPANTPFDAVATAGGARHYDYRQFQGRLSPEDQKNFDKAYEKWTKDRAKHDRDDLAKDEGKMQEIMARNNIPRDVPYDLLVSGARGY